jgi:hypothetical protein
MRFILLLLTAFLFMTGKKESTKAPILETAEKEISVDRFRESYRPQYHFAILFDPYLIENDFIFKNGTRFVNTRKKQRSQLRIVATHLM